MAASEKEKGPIGGLAAVSASLLDTGRYSDLTIKCQGRVFKVHRSVVNSQSAPLAAHVDGEFKEGITGEIDLPEDDPKTIANLIQFLYTENFEDEPAPGDALAEGRLVTCTKAYVVADKYDVPALKKLATNKFEKAVATEWNDDSLAQSPDIMYSELPESDLMLKEVAIRAASKHVKELVDRGESVTLCKASGEVSFDILKRVLSSAKPKASLGRCPNFGASHNGNISWQVPGSEFYCSACGAYLT